MKLHFLGTGGGRHTTSRQKRKTGGILLETDETALHIDPGPGALVELNTGDYPLEKLEGLIVSHSHLDHYSDAEPVIELMTHGMDNYCQLMAPESVLKGFSDTEKSVSNYHQRKCNNVVKLENRTATEFKDLEIKSQEMFHTDPKCIGVTVSDGEKKWGFWTDTRYSDELIEFYNDCNMLVVFCFAPWNGTSRKHTTLSDVPNILEDSEASTVIITHFGSEFLDSDLKEQKALLEEEIDQKVIFADDGMTFPGNRSLGDF